ncbi:MAG: hypothetical protein OEZ22_06140 [Spirochaetia bacterium]|nr:hypothetical protein [Spirochaetia bacterium]
MKIMNKNLKNKSWMIALAFIFTASISQLHAISAAEKAREKRVELMDAIVFLNTAVTNFGTGEQKNQYDEFKSKSSKALAFYFEENYSEAYKQFLEVQLDIEKLLENLSSQYIERSEKMMSELVTEVMDINIEYDKRGEYVTQTLKNKEPNLQRTYDHVNYHLTYDKRPMTFSIDYGYKDLGTAKKVRQRAIDIEKHLEEGQKLTPRHRKERIEKYIATIKICRKAKDKALNIHRLNNRNDIYSVQTQYKDNPYMVEKKLDPVFDTRIPDEYKIDANDNLNRIHEKEVSYKLEGKPYRPQNQKEKKSAKQQENKKEVKPTPSK